MIMIVYSLLNLLIEGAEKVHENEILTGVGVGSDGVIVGNFERKP